MITNLEPFAAKVSGAQVPNETPMSSFPALRAFKPSLELVNTVKSVLTPTLSKYFSSRAIIGSVELPPC